MKRAALSLSLALALVFTGCSGDSKQPGGSQSAEPAGSARAQTSDPVAGRLDQLRTETATAMGVSPLREEVLALIDKAKADLTTATTAPSPSVHRGAGRAQAGNVCSIDPRDGASAINAAIGACPNGSTVRFPPNRTYRQAETIWVKNRHDLVIDGNGSTFVSSAPNDNSRIVPNWYIMRSTRITMRNMTITGNFFDRGDPTPMRGSITSNAGVGIAGGADIELSDIKIRDVFGDGVFTANAFYHDREDTTPAFVTNLRMTRLDISNAARHCVSPNQGTDIWLVDSLLDRCFLDAVDAEKDHLTDPLSGLHFIGNTFTNYFGGGIFVPIGGPHGTPVRGVEIRENRFPTLPYASVCNPQVALGGYPGQFFENVEIHGNTMAAWRGPIVVQNVLSGHVSGNRASRDPRAGVNDCGPTHEPTVVASNSPGLLVSPGQ